MRIAAVFSSPSEETAEYRNIWKRCPASRKLDPDKLVIEGRDWSIYAFNGQSRTYHYRTWKFDTLIDEITKIMEEHTAYEFGLLLHGSKKELSLLVDHLEVPAIRAIRRGRYGSTDGTFFKDCIKPFSNDCSDALFEMLWGGLQEIADQEFDTLDVKSRLTSMSHQLSGMIRSIRMILEDAKKDISCLKDFKTFDFSSFMEELTTIETQTRDLDIQRVNEAFAKLKDIQNIIDEISKKNTYSPLDLDLGSSSLERAEDLKAILHSWEADHG